VFFQALLVSGSACVAFTFFAATSEGIPATTFNSYHHGLVNPNNAAAYLGIMLLLTLMQVVRYLRRPARITQRSLVILLDRLSVGIVTRGGFLLFSLLLFIAGLFLTASRAGITLSLLVAVAMLVMIAFKSTLNTQRRNLIMSAATLLLLTLTTWSYFNFGQVISYKFRTDGISSNSRTDIITAVMPMIYEHPLLGSGLGSFPSVFQQYRPITVSSDGIIDKAHNSYAEFAAEMGLPAFFMLMGALGWMGAKLYRGFIERKERYVVSAMGLSVWLLVALYSLVDFPLQIPGIAALCLTIVTIAVSQTDRRFSEPASRGSVSASQRVRIRKRRSSNVKAI
ncbi:MAG: O-antigen ligase family protein, partial [Bradyrhizobium sp.]|nr:O-antigen ligase family protein [Bradyrhizobium sp.]